MSKTAFLFPGQASQYPGMGLDLYQKFPAAKAVFDEADAALGFPISKLCFEGSEDDLKLAEEVTTKLIEGHELPYRTRDNLKVMVLGLHHLEEYAAHMGVALPDLDVLEKLNRYEPRAMGGQPPVVWDHAEGFQVWDPWGNCWIDWSSGVLITNAGHAGTYIVAARTATRADGSAEVSAFTSKYDAWLAGKAKLTGREIVCFDDEQKALDWLASHG